MKKLLLVLLAVPLLLLCLGLLSVSFLVLHFLPPLVTWVAVAMMTVLALWFLFARRRESAGAFTESQFSTKSSKEGLL